MRCLLGLFILVFQTLWREREKDDIKKVFSEEAKVLGFKTLKVSSMAFRRLLKRAERQINSASHKSNSSMCDTFHEVENWVFFAKSKKCDLIFPSNIFHRSIRNHHLTKSHVTFSSIRHDKLLWILTNNRTLAHNALCTHYQPFDIIRQLQFSPCWYFHTMINAHRRRLNGHKPVGRYLFVSLFRDFWMDPRDTAPWLGISHFDAYVYRLPMSGSIWPYFWWEEVHIW